METKNAIVDEANCEKPLCDEGKQIKMDGENQNANIECNKDVSGVEEEDVVLSEVEASKDFGGNIDEDELLKDTEGEENCSIEIGSSKTLNPSLSSCNLKNDFDTSEDKCKQSIDESIDENEDVTIQGNATAGEEMPDSSSEKLNETEMNENTEEDKGMEITGENEKGGDTELVESVNNKSKECELSDGETAVTSSIDEAIKENSDASLHIFSETNEVIENSEELENNSLNNISEDNEAKTDNVNNVSLNADNESNEVIENSDEIETNSLNNISGDNEAKSDKVNNVSLNADDESNEVIENSDEIENNSLKNICEDNESKSDNLNNASLNTDDESNEKTSCSNDNQNKSDSCDGTKFLHIDQDNSRPEESFEAMETGGEDPFAQTSDIAMDTSESNEKEAGLEKSDVSMETTDVSMKTLDVPMETSDVPIESSGENENVEVRPDVTTNVSEKDEMEKSADNDPKELNSGVVDLGDTDPSLADKNIESNSEKTDNNKTADSIIVAEEKGIDVVDLENIDYNNIEANLEKSDSKKTAENIIVAEEKGIDVVDLENIDYSSKNDEGIEKNKDQEVIASSKNAVGKTGNIEKDDITVVSAQKSKSSRPQGSRSKRKSSSEDSDSDIDITELQSMGPIPKRTPKRNAAKRAETQIKVLSQLDQEIKERINEQASTSFVNYKKTNDPVTTSEGTQTIQETPDVNRSCFTCKKVGPCMVGVSSFGKPNYFCNNDCYITFRDGPVLKPGEGGEIIPPSTVMSQLKSADIQPIVRAEFIRRCSQCSVVVSGDDEKILSWETMDFCNEECLGKYQQELGSHCANCKGNVQQTSLGKYCVRFGYEVKQFCCSTCLEEFKKGLKVCSFCQKDISSGAEGFLAPVGDKGTFKDFCTPACMEKYEQMSSNQTPPPQMHTCDVCNQTKQVEVEVFFDNKLSKLCSDICFTAYKFANKLTVDRCDMCRKYFDKDAIGEKFNIFYDSIPHNFCSKTCMNVYILAKRKIVPCNWCKVKKYNFDMIKRVHSSGQVLMMCSLNCLTLYHVSVNAVSSKRIKCDMCNSVAQAQYHLTMSDATIRNFCNYPCVMNFQQQYSKSPITLPGSGDGPPIPAGAPKRVIPKNDTGVPVPVISSVTSLANGQPTKTTITAPTVKQPSGKLNLVARLCEPPITRNKFTQTRPIMNTKSVSCRPHSNSVEVQTEPGFGQAVIPIPVPIYVPCPMAMYSMPFPVPTPFPLPIPVPIFLPTTRNSIKGIMKEIKRIMEKVPEDPFEAELLMMAEMVAEDKPQEKASSDSEAEPDNDAAPSPANSDANGDGDGGGDGGVCSGGEEEEKEFIPVGEGSETNNAFGDDIINMALKMATELDTPATGEDPETQPPSNNLQQAENSNDGHSSDTVKKEIRGRKRAAPGTKTSSNRNNSLEAKRRKSQHNSETSQPSPVPEEPKPDANMKLKFMFGVNAWKTWVTQKNAEIEKLNATSEKKLKPFKTDMLQLTTDELNFSLCLFMKEVKKPNGTPYAPDTIYYLCLGIQLYLFENGRIDNIFTDPYFETFTDALDEVAKKFSEIFNDHHYIVTRVEEEHLWESKQLGAHSPHVLLSTLMFFNTKHFNLTNVDEHLLLSFSHIMKHWKRNQNQSSSSGRAPGSRNVLLRFYPPQSLIDDPNLKKKKVYEQQENEENPLRCPVKLYEFYLSKCPESVKNRNDVFYLQPERSCVPDSPVWYSTMALQREPLEKMLNRVKMVKEINIALLVP